MSFAPLTHRVMILIEVELADGSVGVGESWANYPAWAWRERTATIHDGVAPLLTGRRFPDPATAQRELLAELTPLGRQWGAPGPVHQAISGVDMALWDLAARHAGTSLARLLSPAPARSCRCTAPASDPPGSPTSPAVAPHWGSPRSR